MAQLPKQVLVKGKRVPFAVIVAEKALGKKLPVGAEVHHVNGNNRDDRPENLVICQDHAYHKLLHVRTEALLKCGNANLRRCYICGSYDEPAAMIKEKPNRPHGTYIHRECKNRRGRAYRNAKA